MMAFMTFVIGCDIGTSSTKSVLVDVESGDVLAAASSAEYVTSSPKPKWSEEDADIWMHACFESIGKVIALSRARGITPKDVTAVCISALNPGSGIPLGKQLRPIHPALIWNDARAVREARDALEKIGPERLVSITGNTSDAYFGFTKMLWIKNNLSRVWERTYKFATPNGYAAYLLTGTLLYDLCYAGNLGGVFDINHLDWSDELLNELGIPRDRLPDLVSCDQIVGEVTSQGEQLSGLKRGTPVAAGGNDAPTSALGSGALNDGEHNFMYGTSGCWNMIQDNRVRPWKITRSLINYPFVVDSNHKLESFGGSKTTGHCFRWFANLTGMTEEALDGQAESSLAAERGVLFIPQMMGERTPDWNPSRFGSFHGLAGVPTRGEMYRAILESVAFDLLRHQLAWRNAGMRLAETMLISGPTAKSRVYRTVLANVTGYRVLHATRSSEAPGGDALIAALATKQIHDAKIIKTWLRLDDEKVTKPNKMEHEKYLEFFGKVWLPSYAAAKPIDDVITSWTAR
jgi:sugar (pentulose or hexulose) kinase